MNDKAIVIEQAYNELRISRSKVDLDALQMHLHRLAGSSGMYGLPEISEHAKLLEAHIIELPQQIDELGEGIQTFVIKLKKLQPE